MAGLKTILCIEDDRFISELYTRALSHAGYTVEAVITGPEGLEKAKTGQYDLVLLDIMLPDKTGIEVLKELRGPDGKGLPNSKIVIATNLEQDEASRAELERMADGYLIKADLTPRKLVEIIKQLEEFGRVEEPTPEGPAAQVA